MDPERLISKSRDMLTASAFIVHSRIEKLVGNWGVENNGEGELTILTKNPCGYYKHEHTAACILWKERPETVLSRRRRVLPNTYLKRKG